MKVLTKLASLLFAMLLSGCISSNVVKDVELTAESMRKGPQQLPVKNVTDFNDSLRCMDDLFLSFGISRGDYVMMAEELKDKTKKVNAGTRQMMISAISNMTTRSGALRLITYGADSGNLISFLNEAGNKGVYQNIPAFDIIGSISQYDDSVYKKQADASAELAGTVDGSTLGGGGGTSASNSVTFMTVDLGVVTAHNLALLPGVSTRNSVSLFNKGSASSYDAGISKTGVSYSFSSDTKDAVGQSLRGLIELSTIELIGKLVKLPYWNCLGMNPDHEDIKNEVSDWYFQLRQTNILHRTIKLQLAIRGLYQGPIDEQITEEYLNAVVKMRQALGLSLTPEVDLAFYTEFLNKVPVSMDKDRLAYSRQSAELASQEKHAQANSEGLADEARSNARKGTQETSKTNPGKAVEPAAELIELSISSDINVAEANVGDELTLNISSNQDGYLACYFQRGEAMVRIFPNRFSEGAFLPASSSVQLPNSAVYSLIVDKAEEQIHCFVTPADIEPEIIAEQLPSELNVDDFAPIANISSEQIREAYGLASTNRYAYDSIQFSGN